MDNLTNYFYILIILFCFVKYGILPFFSKDKSLFWTPINFIIIVYLYYVVMPFFKGNITGFWWLGRMNYHLGEEKFLACVTLSLISTIVGFHHVYARNWLKGLNKSVNTSLIVKYGVFLFAIGLICYVPFRGFTLSVQNSGNIQVFEDTNAFAMYFVNALSLTIAGCAFALIGVIDNKKYLWLFITLLWITAVTFIFSGFRFRLVILAVSLATVLHLYRSPKRINLAVWIPILVGFYILMGIMDKTRSYSNGLDLSRLDDVPENQRYSGAAENEGVYAFSCLVMDRCENYPLKGFDPIWRAITMPFPRALFPWKPGPSEQSVQQVVFGDEFGCAYIMPVDNWLSYRWLGVLAYGLFMGYLCSIFWNNYRKNPHSVGAIVLLALFNGFTYVMISRGYVAQVFTTFIFFVILPFWIIKFLNKLLTK